MRTLYATAFAASLFAVPAMGQVVIQTPNPYATQHQMQADQDRQAAHAEHQQAQMDAAAGNYGAAAQAQSDARQDMHAARRQEDRATDSSGAAVVIGR
jgi:hypothetical protein